jgi:biotin carboxylase
MQKLLIVGASILQLPAIVRAKELGLRVAVVDYNPQAIGIKYADEYYNTSTIDIDAICKIVKTIRPDGIMTLATDMPVRAIAKATTLLGLRGISFETAVNATDKGEMIKVFEKYNVASPWYYIVENEMELLNLIEILAFPCIMKPTDSSGSRGVVLVRCRDEIKQSYSYSKAQSKEGKIIIEEYLVGPEVSVEVMVVNEDIHILAITDKITTGGPHFVEMGHSQQSQLKQEDLNKISDLAIRAVKAIGVNCGPAHVEIMLTDTGPKMIELGARMGGDCITTHLVPLSTGIDMVKATIDIALGELPCIKPKLKKGSAIIYLSAQEGIISSIERIEEAKQINGIKEIFFTKNIGDVVLPIKSSIDRIGSVIAQGENAEEALNICRKAIQQIKINTH